jgi:hypothetical protein
MHPTPKISPNLVTLNPRVPNNRRETFSAEKSEFEQGCQIFLGSNIPKCEKIYEINTN